MPVSRNQRFSKKAQNSVFNAVLSEGIKDPSKLLNAIEFIEGPNGLGMVLRPVQRVIVKCLFSVPFDFKPAWAERVDPLWGKVEMWDVYREKLKATVTEAEYLQICNSEGRCNLADWRDIPEYGYNEGVVFAGRRSGKSELVASIASFKLYMLLNLSSPQKFFGLGLGSNIDFTFLAQDEKGAGRLFSKLQGLVGRANFFAPYLSANNKNELSFITEADRIARETKPTITVSSLACSSNAVRSPSSVFLALDEFAHFRSAKGSTSDDMYSAATPATLDFHHKELTKPKLDGEPKPQILNEWGEPVESEEEGDSDVDLEAKSYPEEVEIQDSMILCISSPLKRVGKMYDLHKMALEDGNKSDIFTLNCPTAEMNIKVLSKVLKAEYRKNSLTFKCEYGGQFLDSSESYLSEQAIKNCTDVVWDDRGLPVEGTARGNLIRFNPYVMLGRNYFWGFDLGMTKDGSALAIAHLESGGADGGIKLVYDYIDRMMVGELGAWPGVTSAPGERKFEKHSVLPMADILKWLQAMNEMMPCFRGATDQHGGQQLVQQLETKLIHNVELVHLTPAINSQMAYALRGYVENGLCSFPYVPKFIKELQLVELQVTSKYQIKVEAPLEKGARDDMADAAQLVAYIAQKWLIEEGNLHRDPSGMSIRMQEQQSKPTGIMKNLDGVSMTTLKVQERTQQMAKKFGSAMGGVPVSPFFKRGRVR
jgi:hypothetical protein